MTTDETLNELLVRLFKDIMEIEGKCLVTEEFKDISYNDFHVIEAIGLEEPKTMTTVAKLMNVTTGTLTKADGRSDEKRVCHKGAEYAGQACGLGIPDGKREGGLINIMRLSPGDDCPGEGAADGAGDPNLNLCAGKAGGLFSLCIQGRGRVGSFFAGY